MKDKERVEGFDLVDYTPDYTKTKEENLEIIKKRYEKAYGKAVADEIFKDQALCELRRAFIMLIRRANMDKILKDIARSLKDIAGSLRKIEKVLKQETDTIEFDETIKDEQK